MSDKVKVASITIEYPGGELKPLSVDDARELYRQLHELFGTTSVTVLRTPFFIERKRYPRWNDTWCGSSQSPHTLSLPATIPPAEKPRVWCSEERTE